MPSSEDASSRVQCSTGPFWAFELESALEAIAEAGFREIELMITRDPRTHDPELPLQLAEEQGLEISAIHAPFLVLTRAVWGLNPIEKIRRGLRFCETVGARTMVVHPPFLWEREYARWVEAEAADFSSQTGVKVAIETMYPAWVGRRAVGAYRWLTPQALARAAPWVAMDTSHLTLARQNVLDAYEVLAPKLVQLHLSNNAGDGRDGHLELEQGVVPVDALIEKFRRSDCDADVCLELSIRRYLERPKELVAMLERNRTYVEERLSRARGAQGQSSTRAERTAGSQA